jgi:hypothetical protein
MRSSAGLTGAIAADAASGLEPLKVVATPRRLGEKVTLYEIAPGDTVTLTESIPMQLSEVVVTSGASSPVTAQAAGKSAVAPSKGRANAPAAPTEPAKAAASDSQGAVRALAAVSNILATDQAQQTRMANAVHTITWTDPATRSRLTLTGRMPEARLQEIRIRIERERATAKRNP